MNNGRKAYKQKYLGTSVPLKSVGNLVQYFSDLDVLHFIIDLTLSHDL